MHSSSRPIKNTRTILNASWLMPLANWAAGYRLLVVLITNYDICSEICNKENIIPMRESGFVPTGCATKSSFSEDNTLLWYWSVFTGKRSPSFRKSVASQGGPIRDFRYCRPPKIEQYILRHCGKYLALNKLNTPEHANLHHYGSISINVTYLSFLWPVFYLCRPLVIQEILMLSALNALVQYT